MKAVKKTVKRQKRAYDGIYNRYIKRIMDFTITGIALCFLWPFYLIISLFIAIEDGFPVFYRADRGGYMGKPFRICKFRSMIHNADKVGGGTTALHDPRTTKMGSRLSTKEQKNLQRNGNTAFCGVFFLPIFRFCPYYGYQHA